MRIAMIGAGNVGGALGKGWLKAGHEVTFGVPNPADSKYDKLKKQADVVSVSDVATDAEIIVLATPWDKTQEAIEQAGDLSGKILVDCTNPLKPDLSGLSVGHDSSGAEQVAQWAKGASVVKAFNTVGFNIMENPVLEGRKTVMFVCGDDESARSQVASLSNDLGFETIQAGELSTARLLEPFALVWISMAYKFDFGRDFGFSIVKKQ